MTRVAPVVPAATDLLCEGCGYTLTGLPTGANCPECGRPVESSVGHTRTPPDWELDPRPRGSLVAFLATTASVTFRPTRFYRTTTVRGDVARARWFALIHWAVAALLFVVAAWLHARMLWWGDLPMRRSEMLRHLAGVGASTLLILGVLAGITWFAAKLTTWEATYRGIRLPVGVVLRGMYYHAAHYVPVAIVTFATVAGYRLLLRAEALDIVQTATNYLYVLCGEVIVFAAYLFHTYWIAMRNMMYANR